MKILRLLLVLLSIPVFAQKNTIFKATYQYHKILTDKEKAKMDSLLKYDSFYRSFSDFEKHNGYNKKMILFFDKSTSTYYQEYIFNDIEAYEYFYEVSLKTSLYKNLNEKQYWQNKQILDKYFTITDSLPDYKWEITGESKKIGSYLTIKAIGEENKIIRKGAKNHKIKRKLTAWFCPEIPISNGPELYGGLPGLIMEISSEREIYVLKELLINPKKKLKIKKPKIHKMKGNILAFYKESKKAMDKLKQRYTNRRQQNIDWRNE
jgi:GLPGLI family protein